MKAREARKILMESVTEMTYKEGKAMKKALKALEKRIPMKSEVNGERHVMFCPVCGSICEIGDKFCSRCGQRIFWEGEE